MMESTVLPVQIKVRYQMATFSLLQEEYQTLRREVEARLAEVAALEKNSLFAVSAALAWFSTQPLKGPFLVAWFAPFILVLFAVLRTRSVRRQLGRLSQYLARIEEAARLESTLCMGWEHFQNLLSPDRPKAILRGEMGIITALFWSALAFGSLAFGIFGFLAQSQPNVYKWLQQLLTGASGV